MHCCNKEHNQQNQTPQEHQEHKEAGVYTCPMHPEVRRDRPGMCPECGMNLIKNQKSKIKNQNFGKSENHDKHEGHSTKMFLKKFWASLALTIPVVAYSDILFDVFGWSAPAFAGSQYLPFVLGSVVFFYGGWIFLTSAYRELRARLPGMMTLIALAILAAYFYSVFATFSRVGHTLFWELTTLITIMLLGHWVEMRAVQGAKGALKELAKLLPDTAELIIQNTEIKKATPPLLPTAKAYQNDNSKFKIETKSVAISELRVDDIVLVRPGGRIPIDGLVIEGQSEVNESMITGESRPVAKQEGSEVIAGTINGDGSLKIKVTKIGEHTFLAGIMRLVQEAEASKSRLQMLSDKAAFYLTIVAIGAGSITFVAWLFAQADIVFATERLVAVLVIVCPHALGLAIPLVASISTTLAARNGLLIKRRLALEMARSLNVVLFDKTGTLTKGEYGVTQVIQNSKIKISENDTLRLAAAVESHSEHPAALAIVAEARKRDFVIPEIKDFERIPGKGISGESRIMNQESRIIVGNETLMKDEGVVIDQNTQAKAKELELQGKTVVWVASRPLIHDSRFMLHGFIALADIIRDESREAITALKKEGVKVAMITGDSEDVAQWVAGELGIDEYYARVLPGEKAEIVKKIQNPKSEIRNPKQILNSNFQNSKLNQTRSKLFVIWDLRNWNLFGNLKLEIGNSHKRVAFVGDGVNDAPALTQADLGIAIGAGTNVAIESAGIILVRNDPRDIPKIIALSRATYKKMIQNLFWATGYNVVALPLAAGVLASQGILLQPALAALFMSLSTVIVAINAVLLRRTVL